MEIFYWIFYFAFCLIRKFCMLSRSINWNFSWRIIRNPVWCRTKSAYLPRRHCNTLRRERHIGLLSGIRSTRRVTKRHSWFSQRNSADRWSRLVLRCYCFTRRVFRCFKSILSASEKNWSQITRLKSRNIPTGVLYLLVLAPRKVFEKLVEIMILFRVVIVHLLHNNYDK